MRPTKCAFNQLLGKSNREKNEYIQILNNVIDYLSEQGKDKDQILTIFDITPEKADELGICL